MMEQGASIDNDNKCESHYQIQENRIGGVIVVVCACFVDGCLYLLCFVFWPLCCLFFFDLRILITPLVSSSSP